jgi:DNA-binding transcriptional MocR family regulator
VIVEQPLGGLFAWLRLPDGLSSEKLLDFAEEEGVRYSPGNHFFPDGFSGQDFLRLNFVAQVPAEIDEGIKRLGRAIKLMATSSKNP